MAALDLYAPGRARISRWVLGISGMLLLAYGAYSLYYALPQAARAPIGGWRPLGDAFPVSWALIGAIVALLAGAGGAWWLVNYKRLVDFLHDVEVEMGKVSWASRKEVVSNSIVVIVATTILAGWVFIADVTLAAIRQFFAGG